MNFNEGKGHREIYFSIPVASAAVSSKAVILLLFIYCLLIRGRESWLFNRNCVITVCFVRIASSRCHGLIERSVIVVFPAPER